MLTSVDRGSEGRRQEKVDLAGGGALQSFSTRVADNRIYCGLVQMVRSVNPSGVLGMGGHVDGEPGVGHFEGEPLNGGDSRRLIKGKGREQGD